MCSCCVPSADKQPYAYQMVRTDAREQKLDAFVVPESLQSADSGPEASVVAMETEGETGVPSVTEDQSGQSGVQDQGANTVRKKPDSSFSQRERFVRNFFTSFPDVFEPVYVHIMQCTA